MLGDTLQPRLASQEEDRRWLIDARADIVYRIVPYRAAENSSNSHNHPSSFGSTRHSCFQIILSPNCGHGGGHVAPFGLLNHFFLNPKLFSISLLRIPRDFFNDPLFE